MMTWYCPACVNVPFTLGRFSISSSFAFFESTRTKRILVIQWETAWMFSFPPTSSSRRFTSFSYFPIASLPFLFFAGFPYSMSIP